MATTGNNGGSGRVVEIGDDTFQREVLESETPVLVDFMADWCRPCKVMGPVFAELAPEYAGRLKFAKVNVDDNPDSASAAGVLNLPTFVLFSRGAIVSTGMGSMPAARLRGWIDQGLSKSGVAAAR